MERIFGFDPSCLGTVQGLELPLPLSPVEGVP